MDDLWRSEYCASKSPALENYEKYKDQILIHQALTGNNIKPGDYMLSQGFFTTHVESTIGCSERSRKHASDAHNMVTLCGRRAPLQNAEQRDADTFEQTGDAKPLPEEMSHDSASECDDEPMRPCGTCQIELHDDPRPWKCRACSKETCYNCLGRCNQAGCHQRFCSHCLSEHEMHCLGRGDFTFQLCWTSGECIQRLQGCPDFPIEQLKQYMDEGLVQGLPKARTNHEGEWLESYSLIYGTEVMTDGTVLSDYELQPDDCLTVVLSDISEEREQTSGAKTN